MHNDRIGYLPQRRSFDASIRVRGVDLVRLGLTGTRFGVSLPLRRAARERHRHEGRRVQEMVDLVGAHAYAGRPIGQLSGGEQQRLLIAQALVSGPALLLLDEPLESLDLPNQMAVADLVAEICRKEGVTVMIVAHDVNPILGKLDRVAYIAGGQVVAGSPEEVINEATLSRLYGTPVEVIRTKEGRLVVVGEPDVAHHHHGPHGEPLDHQHHHDLRAGAAIAVLASAVGWFMVLRRQSFVGHTIAVVGFPGAAGATLGLSAFGGYFTFCFLAAVLIAVVPTTAGRAFSDENAVTGTVQALLLGFGFLFASLYGGNLNGIDALLFGNFLGISNGEVLVLAVICVVTLAAIAVLWEPPLFASIDPAMAGARGLPVRGLGAAFLLLLGLAAAGASQMTGALLVFALLVMPAATVQRLTSRPALGLWLTVPEHSAELSPALWVTPNGLEPPGPPG